MQTPLSIQARLRPTRPGPTSPSTMPRASSWLCSFAGQTFRQGVFFECVGVPGVLDQIMAGAPQGGRVVVVGVCMQTDHIRPLIGINKELTCSLSWATSPKNLLRRYAT